jgi:hypothetical protein
MFPLQDFGAAALAYGSEGMKTGSAAWKRGSETLVDGFHGKAEP